MSLSKMNRMMRRARVPVSLGVLLLALVSLVYYLPASPDSALPISSSVIKIIDGDTLIVSGKGKVRLIGVDTPEMYDSDKLERDAARSGKTLAYIKRKGRMASQFTTELVRGREIILRFDPANQKNGHKDKYGRLLAYVFLEPKPQDLDRLDLVWMNDAQYGNLVFLNASLIKAGHGQAFRRFEYQYKNQFFQLEREAKN